MSFPHNEVILARISNGLTGLLFEPFWGHGASRDTPSPPVPVYPSSSKVQVRAAMTDSQRLTETSAGLQRALAQMACTEDGRPRDSPCVATLHRPIDMITFLVAAPFDWAPLELKGLFSSFSPRMQGRL